MSSQKKKAATKVTARRKRNGGASVGAASAASMFALPSAISTVRRNPTEFRLETITHPTQGLGTRMIGSQQLANITTASTTDLTFFTNTTPATQTSTNLILITPDYFNGRLAAFAGLYAKYVFRRIELEYRPIVATTQAGGGVLAITRDPQVNVSTGALTYSTAQELECAITFAFREPARLVFEYKGPEVFFTEIDPTSQASYRQTAQGQIVGLPSSGSLGAVSQGFVHLHYIVDLFSPTPTQAIVGISAVEREFLKLQLAKFRKDRSSDRKECDDTFDVVVKTSARR